MPVPAVPKPKVSPFIARTGSHPALFAAVTLIAVGGLVFFLAVVPLVRALQSGGAASVADARVALDAAKSSYDAQVKLIDRVAGVSRSDRDLIKYALPDSVDEPGLAVQMQALAAAAGVVLGGIDITLPPEIAAVPGATPELAKPANIAITLRGVSYDRLKIFVGAVESNLRFLAVRSLNYNATAGTAALELRSYYLPSGN
jgi:hypothetical protein